MTTLKATITYSNLYGKVINVDSLPGEIYDKAEIVIPDEYEIYTSQRGFTCIAKDGKAFLIDDLLGFNSKNGCAYIADAWHTSGEAKYITLKTKIL